jgi:hypothetical protein
MNTETQSPDLALTLWLKSLDLPYCQADPDASSSEHPKPFDQLGQISDGEILWQLLSSLSVWLSSLLLLSTTASP